MDLKDIASVSGKSGLFKVVKPTRTGVILETLDEQRGKFIANANTRVSLLKEISIYTSGKESSVALEFVFDKIYENFGNTLKVDSKSSTEDLYSFIETILPEYDKEKVYLSDIKKLVLWYNTIVQFLPERIVMKPMEATKDSKGTEENKESVEEVQVKEPVKAKKVKAEKN